MTKYMPVYVTQSYVCGRVDRVQHQPGQALFIAQCFDGASEWAEDRRVTRLPITLSRCQGHASHCQVTTNQLSNGAVLPSDPDVRTAKSPKPKRAVVY